MTRIWTRSHRTHVGSQWGTEAEVDASSPDAQLFGPAVAELVVEAPAAPLDAGKPSEVVRERIAAIAVADVLAGDADAGMAACCLAGVWLAYGFVDEAHQLCQDVETPAGSYWHGVVHRREGDFGNAAYWFGRAGDLPIGSLPAAEAARSPVTVEAALEGRWNPAAFVDLVGLAVQRGGELREACRAVQAAEWRALMTWCAGGGSAG